MPEKFLFDLLKEFLPNRATPEHRTVAFTLLRQHGATQEQVINALSVCYLVRPPLAREWVRNSQVWS